MGRLNSSPGVGAAGRVVVFVAGLALVFVVSLGIGSLVEPADTEGDGGHGSDHAGAEHGTVPIELGELGVYRASLTFAVHRGGEEVRDLAPYLGAKGHLVALREGDTAGRYRLYLQFRHEGAVRTAEFTVEVPR